MVSCVSNDILIVSGGRPDVPQTLILAGGAIPLGDGQQLSISIQFETIESPDPANGRYKVKTLQYDYQFRDADEAKIFVYHWHPMGNSKFKAPHMHAHLDDARISHKHHIPTGRVSVESVVRYCIDHRGATPRRDDWAEILRDAEEKFVKYRTWP